MVLLLIGVELVARFGLGLGDPPLSVADPEIEYLYKPSSRFDRFGNTISFNRWSMRSPEFTETKAPGERRILVLGDSIVNGGVQTDDSQLATVLLASKLAAGHEGPVTVANISAGSWGPPNLLAYVERFGLFDADEVVIVLNSDDAWDVPGEVSPVGRSASFPDRAPLLATQELVMRYLLPRLGLGGEAASQAKVSDRDADTVVATEALAELLELMDEANVGVAVVYWPRWPEVAGEYEAGYAPLKAAVEQGGVPMIEARRFLEGKEGVYRDVIHPNAQGQKILAEVIAEALERMNEPSAATATN